MQILPYGHVIVTTSGTPVAITTDPTVYVNKLKIKQAPSNGVIKILYNGTEIEELNAAAATGLLDYTVFKDPGGADRFQVSRITIDAATNGQGPFVWGVIE